MQEEIEQIGADEMEQEDLEVQLLICLDMGDQEGASKALQQLKGLSKLMTQFLGILLTPKDKASDIDKKNHPYRLEFKTWNGKGNPGKSSSKLLKEHAYAKRINALMWKHGIAKTPAIKMLIEIEKKNNKEEHAPSYYQDLHGRYPQYVGKAPSIFLQLWSGKKNNEQAGIEEIHSTAMMQSKSDSVDIPDK